MSERVLRGLAPAKINLFLHITGRRDDGYHTLQTAFRMLDHGDMLSFSLRDDGEVRRVSQLVGVEPEQDLVVRAARLLQARTGCRLGVDIEVEKRLPMGGGLGGGSSDAATTLLALNRLWQLGVPRQSLQEWALVLGADVPFFIFGQSAFAEGVGEALRPLRIPPAWYVVVEPPVSVPTVEIFAAKDLTRDTKPLIIAGSLAEGSPGLFDSGLWNATRNDMEAVASRRYPQVAAALEALKPFGTPRMSGSGACVFLPCPDEATARQVVAALDQDWRVWAAAGLDEHPLRVWADG